MSAKCSIFAIAFLTDGKSRGASMSETAAMPSKCFTVNGTCPKSASENGIPHTNVDAIGPVSASNSSVPPMPSFANVKGEPSGFWRAKSNATIPHASAPVSVQSPIDCAPKSTAGRISTSE
ncbi:MAG: hypothetical protein WC263_03510 [Candidatus Micrarchaeia archaeon]